jgi:hypothetical protein
MWLPPTPARNRTMLRASLRFSRRGLKIGVMGTSDPRKRLPDPNQLGKPICYAEFVMLLQPPPTAPGPQRVRFPMRTHVKSVRAPRTGWCASCILRGSKSVARSNDRFEPQRLPLPRLILRKMRRSGS